MNAFLIPFVALVRKDLRLHFSNRRALVMGILAPIAIAAFFGMMFDTRKQASSAIPVAVTDLDRSPLSARVVAALRAEAAIALTDMTEDAARGAVTAGRQSAAIVLPPGLGDTAPAALFGAGPKPAITVVYDPSQGAALAVVRGLLTQHVMTEVGRAAFGNRDAGGSDMRLPFEPRERQATARAGQDYNSYAHSFAGMSVQFILFAGIEFGIGMLMARRLGLWKRLSAAPISRRLLLGSRIASGTLIALVLLAVIYAAAMLFFGVRIQGSVAGFVGIAVAFALLTSSFGLLIAALGRTPEATRALAIFATLLLVMLGGAWVPSFVFPPWLQTASLAVPTRWAVDGLDAMTWRGGDFAAALAPIAVTLAFAIGFAALAIWRFPTEQETSGGG